MAKGEVLRQDEIIEKTVDIKHNHLSVPAMHYLQITLLIERAYKDIL